MRVVVGIDLGSTTTKAVLLDTDRRVVGKGITNSRSNYEVACAVAREEALADARFTLLRRELERRGQAGKLAPIQETFRLEAYLAQLASLEREIARSLRSLTYHGDRASLAPAAEEVATMMRAEAEQLFGSDVNRKSDFFRDLASASFMAAAEKIASTGRASFDRLSSLFDRAILDVETRIETRDVLALIRKAAARHGREGRVEVNPSAAPFRIVVPT